MGWNPFNAFRLDYDEADVLRAAQALLTLKLADVGYRYVNIDDGWWLRRSANTIAIRTELFPSALGSDGKTSFRPFVDRLHGMGLKAGIYTDIGQNNCSQHWDKNSPNLPKGTRPEREVGAMDHYAADARLFFADWGFDFVKVDACGVADYGPDKADVKQGRFRAVTPMIVRDRPDISDAAKLANLYAQFSSAVRTAVPEQAPIFAICAWGEADVNDWAGHYGQMWRTSVDIRATWSSMLQNFDSAASRSLFAGPGRWNDPDLLEIGNGDFDANHLTEARAHMSMWAIIAAPLILSYDLDKAPPAIHAVAKNPDVIAINQDAAGNQGVILFNDGRSEVIVKQLSQMGHKALALINRGDMPIRISVKLTDLHLDPAVETQLLDVWQHQSKLITGTEIDVTLSPHETALFRVEGQPIEAGTVHADEMPARIRVIEDGYKASDRSSKKPWVPARIGFLPDGDAIELNGKADHDFVGVAAGSRVRISLNGEFRRFRTSPRGLEGMGRYAIYADGKQLKATVADRTMLELQVAGIKSLDLVAPVATEKAKHFVWASIRLDR